MNDSDEFSSFELEETVSGVADITNESFKSSNDDKNATNTRRHITTPQSNVSIRTQNYRSPLKDSSNESLTSDSDSVSDAIVLSSDDEDNSNSNTSDSDTEKSTNDSDGTVSSSNDDDKCNEVTKAVYDAHVAQIGEISGRISQYENLLKLSSQLPDKGDKLKQLVVKLKSDLGDKQNALQNFKIKEPRPADLELDFKNLSINENVENVREEASTSDLYSDDIDSITELFKEIKRSEKSMPSDNDLAEQPRLIRGNLMPHQRHALAWMIWRESQFPQGGILGDDMGLGKTLTMISLIARHIEMGESNSVENGKPERIEAGEFVFMFTNRFWVVLRSRYSIPFRLERSDACYMSS